MSTPLAPLFALEGVSVKNRSGHDAVVDLSLAVTRGEAVALIGPGGSGKSIVLRLAAAMEEPAEGRVLYSGEDLATFSYERMRDHRTHVGFVFEQGSLLANRTLAYNIALPLRYHAKGHIDDHEVAARVTALAAECALEGGLDLITGMASPSQQRRALYARALVMDPDLLLVDEPQLALSRTERKKVSLAIERRRKERGMAVILADHDGHMDPFVAERFLFLEDGRLLERPSYAEEAPRRAERAPRTDPPPPGIDPGGGVGTPPVRP